MNEKFPRSFGLFLILLFASISCNLPVGTKKPAVATSGSLDEGGDPTGADSLPATPTLTPGPIVHISFPAVGYNHESTAHDNEESTTYDFKNVQFGDDFKLNRFERPFTREDMTYLPYLDIFDFVMTSDANWYYVDISMIGPDAATGGAPATYGVEFDLDIDGRAEILMLVDKPGSEWSTDRVRVYLDGNGDIGGASSEPDASYSGDGFDTLIFNSGEGDDPDLAWSKAVMTKRALVKFAFKRSLLRNYSKFMWSVFASNDPVDQSKFYYNDTFTEEAAGSPNKNSPYYPIKEISAFDNSCRVPTGFQATGFEPLGCKVSTQIVQGEGPDAESTPAGGITIFWVPGSIDWCRIISCGPPPPR